MSDSDKIYEILMVVKEDVGFMRAKIEANHDDMTEIKKKVGEHETFVTNLKGQVSILALIVSVAGTFIFDFIKKHF